MYTVGEAVSRKIRVLKSKVGLKRQGIQSAKVITYIGEAMQIDRHPFKYGNSISVHTEPNQHHFLLKKNCSRKLQKKENTKLTLLREGKNKLINMYVKRLLIKK